MQINDIVFVNLTEQYRNDTGTKRLYETRSVVLRVKVTVLRQSEFAGLLQDNNGFDKDGQEMIFSKGDLLCNQVFTDLDKLGVWVEN